MKKNSIYRYPSIAAGSLILAGMIGLGSNNSKSFNSLINKSSNDIGIPAKTFFSAFVDNSNNKWFLTELGIISFNGEKWTLHNENEKVPSKDLKDFAYKADSGAPEVWIASPNGATVASFPIDARSDATTYIVENTAILSNNVTKVAIGNGPFNWFGTDKGVSAFGNNKWLTPSYEDYYPGILFKKYPITSMATNRSGDSLYVGTNGAGIARVFRDEVDGISGASAYAQWGPIILPSDNIYSIFIASDGAKWFGTDKGIARHIGNNTLRNWTVYTSEEGLVNNYVQVITADMKGNLWFGTKGGISVYNGSAWTSYTISDGLNSNNILCIAVDKDGLVWIGTDDGVNCYINDKFISYK